MGGWISFNQENQPDNVDFESMRLIKNRETSSDINYSQLDNENFNRNQNQFETETDQSSLNDKQIKEDPEILEQRKTFRELNKEVIENNPNIQALIALEKNQSNHMEIYQIFRKINKENDEFALVFAILEGYCDVCDEDRNNIMLEAAYRGDVGLVQKLYKHGINIHSRNKQGATVLHRFCVSGSIEGVKYALEFIDVNAVTNRMDTPLHWAAFGNRAEVCKVLLNTPGIEKNFKNKWGNTPLRDALDKHAHDAMEVLSDAGCAYE